MAEAKTEDYGRREDRWERRVDVDGRDVSHHKTRWEKRSFSFLSWWFKNSRERQKVVQRLVRQSLGAAGERERERDCSKTEEAKAVFCSVIRRALTPGCHRGCFCSPLERLVVYLHSCLREEREQGGNKTRLCRLKTEKWRLRGVMFLKKICTHLWSFLAPVFCHYLLCILISTVCTPVYLHYVSA